MQFSIVLNSEQAASILRAIGKASNFKPDSVQREVLCKIMNVNNDNVDLIMAECERNT